MSHPRSPATMATPASAAARRHRGTAAAGWRTRYAVMALTAAFAISSFLSVHAYERVTTGAAAPVAYMTNVEQAVTHAAHPLQRSETKIENTPPEPGVRFSGVAKIALVF